MRSYDEICRCQALPVPTLSPALFAILSLLALVVAAFTLRRRSRKGAEDFLRLS